MIALRVLRRLFPVLLISALLCSIVLPAGAEPVPPGTTGETPASTSPPETLPPAAETEGPPQTSGPVQPQETAAPAQPPETSVPTVPPETSAPTVPTETMEPPAPTQAATAPETIPEDTQSTEPTEEPLFEMPRMAVSIAAANAMASGTAGVTVQGTVVYLRPNQALLQDSTGSIWLTFQSGYETLQVGDILLVTGDRIGGFSVKTCQYMGAGDLPAMAAALEAVPQDTRVRVENAVFTKEWSRLYLKQGDASYFLEGMLPAGLESGDPVTAYGILMGDTFYADTVAACEGEEEAQDPEWNLYFGLLHAHSDISGAVGTVAEAFSHAAAVENLDFFAVTDRSNSFQNALSGSLASGDMELSPHWKAGKEAARAVTTGDFVGIYGFEMTWHPDFSIGHVNTFNTPGWIAWEHDAYKTLEDYFTELAAVPGAVSQFNHPGRAYGDFGRFANYKPEYDAVMQLLEVGSEGGSRAYDYYDLALQCGWHVGPTNSQDNHNGNWGSESPVRTVALAKELTENALYGAMANRRVYATEDSDLSIVYRLNGQIMGSIIRAADSLTVTASISDPTDAAIGTVEVVCGGGAGAVCKTVNTRSAELTMTVPAGHDYYYLRVTQPDGDIAVTAPVWVDSYEDVGIRSFEADPNSVEQGETVQLRLELFNEESADFVVEKLEIVHKETVLQAVDGLGTVEACGALTCSVPLTCPEPGELQLTARITGTFGSQELVRKEETLLHVQAKEVAVTTISQVRTGQLGSAYRVAGYVTAGNANPYNTFPNTLYLQDDSGGIAVMGYAGENIQVGTYMEVTGVLRNQGGNLVLELTDCIFPEKTMYRHVPRTMTHDIAMNYTLHGGELLQIEGKVVSLVKTADGKGISRMTLQDIRGDLATVMVESGIASGAYGTNELAADIREGRTVRAMGLLHVDEYGLVVLRVRNCEEVVYLPPIADASNPKTGDRQGAQP